MENRKVEQKINVKHAKSQPACRWVEMILESLDIQNFIHDNKFLEHRKKKGYVLGVARSSY